MTIRIKFEVFSLFYALFRAWLPEASPLAYGASWIQLQRQLAHEKWLVTSLLDIVPDAKNRAYKKTEAGSESWIRPWYHSLVENQSHSGGSDLEIDNSLNLEIAPQNLYLKSNSQISYPVVIHLFQVNEENKRTCEMCSTLIIKILVHLLLTLN